MHAGIGHMGYPFPPLEMGCPPRDRAPPWRWPPRDGVSPQEMGCPPKRWSAPWRWAPHRDGAPWEMGCPLPPELGYHPPPLEMGYPPRDEVPPRRWGTPFPQRWAPWRWGTPLPQRWGTLPPRDGAPPQEMRKMKWRRWKTDKKAVKNCNLNLEHACYALITYFPCSFQFIHCCNHCFQFVYVHFKDLLHDVRYI